MGNRLVGTLVGVILGVVPGIAIIVITGWVTGGFADQAGMPVALFGMLLVVMGAIAGGVVGAQTMPPTRGQVFAGVALGAIPGLVVWRMLGEINPVALVLLIVGPLWLGILGWRADHQGQPPEPLPH